jgi:uncharacterized protein YbdZ (MbtH family)
MKFKIKDKFISIKQRKIFYLPDEFSFNERQFTSEIDYYLILNYLNLTVVNNLVVQVDGFCPNHEWILTDLLVPNYEMGQLMVLKTYEPGFSYRLNKIHWPVYYNQQSGWVCVGDPTKKNQAVEFITNVVAVVENSELQALWLKPVFVSDYE